MNVAVSILAVLVSFSIFFNSILLVLYLKQNEAIKQLDNRTASLKRYKP